MRITGLAASSATAGTIVFVSPKIVWNVNDSRNPLTPMLTELQAKGVLAKGAITPRSFNTKVFAFGWTRPRTNDDAAAQRAALEANAGQMSEVVCLDIPDVVTGAVVTKDKKPVFYVDGGELVVEVAKKCPEALSSVLTFLRDPQRPDWFWSGIFEAAETHKDPKKGLACYEAIISFPVPSASNKHRSTYLGALNNAIVAAQACDVARAKALSDRARPFFKENPYLTHSAACAYAASGDLDAALECAAAAVKTKYEHLEKLRVDPDLGPLLKRADFQALFTGGPAPKAPTKAVKAEPAKPAKTTAAKPIKKAPAKKAPAKKAPAKKAPTKKALPKKAPAKKAPAKKRKG